MKSGYDIPILGFGVGILFYILNLVYLLIRLSNRLDQW